MGNASDDFIKSCDCGYGKDGNLGGEGQIYLVRQSSPKLKRIWLDTDYFRVDLGLIAPVS